MPLFLIIVIVLIALGLGALVGSATTYVVGALCGVALTVLALAVMGAVFGWHNPPQRTDGAPLRRPDRS